MTQLVIATHNAHKLKEFQASFAGALINGEAWVLSSAAEYQIGDIIETGVTFRDNALLKAQTVSDKTGMAALGDDSGLIVEGLTHPDGSVFPGLYSKRFADEQGGHGPAIAEILRSLDGRPARASYICVLALVRSNFRPLIVEGRVSGRLVWPERGAGNFGYDPWFQPDGEDRTFGEMSLDEKRALDHRTKAVNQLLNILQHNTRPETC